MDIDFANLTDEMKAALKENLEKIEEAAGVVAFDPNEPLSRTAMEQLKIKQKIAGKDEELTVYDAAQKAAKAGGADKAFREKAALEARIEHLESFSKAIKNKEMPSDDAFRAVAEVLDTDVPTLRASVGLDQAGDDDQGGTVDTKTQPKGQKATQQSQATKKITLEDLDASVLERILPTKYHGQHVSQTMKTAADKMLDDEITKALTNSPALAKLQKTAEGNPNQKFVLDEISKVFKSTVDKQARGRIIEMQQTGTGDILEEIPGIVKGLVESTDLSGILAKATPQPIIIGGGEPGDMPLSVLSGEKLKDDLRTDDPDYLDNEVKIMAQRLAGAGSTA